MAEQLKEKNVTFLDRPKGITPPNSMLEITTNEQIDFDEAEKKRKEQEQALEQGQAPEVIGAIQLINERWTAAKNAKILVETRLEKCRRQVNGEYDPDVLASIKALGGTDIFMQITGVKKRAATSWIRDIQLPAGERPWDVKPTPIPELPQALDQAIRVQKYSEAIELAQLGEAVDPDAVQKEIKSILDNQLKAVKDEASRRAERMAARIEDKLVEGRFYDAINEFIEDICEYPTAFLNGPTIRQEKELVYSPEGEPVVRMKLIREFECVSPFDMYPAPAISNLQHGYFFHIKDMTKGELRKCKGAPNFDSDEIDRVIKENPRGLKEDRPVDQELEDAKGKDVQSDPDGIYRVKVYWGSLSGDQLLEAGFDENKVVPDEDYEVNAWLIGNYLVKLVLNPDPLGRRPYYCASFQNVNGSIWGKALPEIMRDVQRMCNASARDLANNMGFASGPQIEIDEERVDVSRETQRLIPWKIRYTRSDPFGSNMPAVRHVDIPIHAAELMGVYTKFEEQADKITGIPAYTYGSGDTKGAGATASGLSMLMDAASKGLKQVIGNIDRGAIIPVIQMIYSNLMLYDKDKSIKGDIKVIARASAYLIQEAQITMRRTEAMPFIINLGQTGYIDFEGMTHVVRDYLKSLKFDHEKIVPTDKEILEQKIKEFYARQQMAALGPGASPSAKPEELSPSGEPMSGKGSRLFNQGG